ncbi:ribokinase [Bacillus sp. DJP31]|uniref:ribokinase n=1 Tax=Bacillus sp. DJP31 TaxID=3409789 RepID=UPI003BB69A92
MTNKITVIGSINMDLVTRTTSLPQMGETVLGSSFLTTPGGKGANQAVAAAKLGADVTLIGCVGDDMFGDQLKRHLQNQGVRTDYIKTVKVETGIASITLANGDNSIIVVPGANSELSVQMVEELEHEIAGSKVLLLQLEIPLATVYKAVELANKHKVRVILNPAPIQLLPKELLQKVDYLTPNEYEQTLLITASQLTATERKEIEEKCIVTKGNKGVSFFEKFFTEVPAYTVEVVDSTGAGDSFNGALAVALGEGKMLQEAILFANAVGALSVTKLGAQTGMPTKEEVTSFLLSIEG